MIHVNCGDHIHLVYGDSLTSDTRAGQVSWPLYTSREVEQMFEVLKQDKSLTKEERVALEKAEATIMKWAKGQYRDEKGRFTRFHNMEEVREIEMNRRSVVEAWGDFIDGKSDMCNFIMNHLLGAFVYPLYDCKFVKYHSEPSRRLDRRNAPEWKGEFRIPTDA